jgi:hypothetical protein
MAGRTTRGNVTRAEDGRKEVLGLVSVVLPGSWWWLTEDLNEPGAKGAVFRCYEEGNDQELAYLLVADVTSDPDEPDVTAFGEEDVERFDGFLERETRQIMARQGRKLLKWQSSGLSEPASGKGLTSWYVAQDQGRPRQYIDLRIRIAGRNVVIGGCYDVHRGEDLEKAIMWAIQHAASNGRLR